MSDDDDAFGEQRNSISLSPVSGNASGSARASSRADARDGSEEILPSQSKRKPAAQRQKSIQQTVLAEDSDSGERHARQMEKAKVSDLL